MRPDYTDFKDSRTMRDLERYAASAKLKLNDPEDGSIVFFNEEVCITVPDTESAVVTYYPDEPCKGERYYSIKYGNMSLNHEGRPEYDTRLELAPSYCCFCSPTFTGYWDYTGDEQTAPQR